MDYRFPHRRELKVQAKRLMTNPTALRVTLILVGLMVGVYGLKYMLDAILTYALVDLNQYQDTATGIYFNNQGFSLIFRMDLTEMVLAVPLTYTQIAAFLAVSALCFLFLAPLRVGVMEVYWQVLKGEQPTVKQVLEWLTQTKRMGKALVVEFVLQVAVRLVGILATVPSLYLYYIFYTNVKTLADMTTQMSMVQSVAGIWAALAGMFCFWLHGTLLPVRYCLAAHPEYSLGDTFRRGLASMKGYRNRFFWFRLTFAPWFFLSQMSYNTLDLYVLPYTSMASMLYVQEVARERQAMAQQ